LQLIKISADFRNQETITITTLICCLTGHFSVSAAGNVNTANDMENQQHDSQLSYDQLRFALLHLLKCSHVMFIIIRCSTRNSSHHIEH